MSSRDVGQLTATALDQDIPEGRPEGCTEPVKLCDDYELECSEEAVWQCLANDLMQCDDGRRYWQRTPDFGLRDDPDLHSFGPSDSAERLSLPRETPGRTNSPWRKPRRRGASCVQPPEGWL